jgi:hypothetical protein
MKNSVDSNQIIECYLCDVEKILPIAKKDVILKNLKAFIMEQIAEDEARIYKVLEDLGSPKRIEDNYEIVWKPNKT